MLYTIRDGDGDNKIDVSPNGTLTMTRAAVQPTAVINALEEILVLEILYAAGVRRRVILNIIAKLKFNSLPMALPSVTITVESTWLNSKGSNSLLALNRTLALNQTLHRLRIHLILPLLCSSCLGMDLLRQNMSGHLNNHLITRDLTTTRTS
jgi:hypothetical protein